MDLNQLEQLIATLPKTRLSIEADLRIRTKLAAYMTPVTTPAFRWRFEFSIPRFVLAPVLAGFVLFGSTSAYAYMSPHVTRTSALYPLKRGLERARTVTERSTARRAIAALDFADRRAAEAQILTTRADARRPGRHPDSGRAVGRFLHWKDRPHNGVKGGHGDGLVMSARRRASVDTRWTGPPLLLYAFPNAMLRFQGQRRLIIVNAVGTNGTRRNGSDSIDRGI